MLSVESQRWGVSLSRPLRRRRINKELPEIPPLDPNAWREVFEAVNVSAPCLGPCSMELHDRNFLAIQDLIPQVGIIRIFTSRQAKQLQSPIGAPLIQDAPWRISIGKPDGDLARILAYEERKSIPRNAMHARCVKCPILLTVFAGPPRAQPVAPVPMPVPLEDSVSSSNPAAAGPNVRNAPETRNPEDAEPPPTCLEGWAPPPVALHGPAFRNLTNKEKTELIRMHNNLGHPTPERLAQHLSAAGAAPHVVAACKEFVCDACVESAQPSLQRPSKLHDPTEFNDIVGVDGFFWRGSGGFQAYVVHAIDESSCFHLGRRTKSRHGTEVMAMLRETWMSWAGPPKHLYLDPAGELRSQDFLTALQELNIISTSEAWQRGRIERHGDVVKEMLSRVDGENPLSSLEMFDQVLCQCFHAKNSLSRHKGYAPEQLVLGKSLRIPASLTSDENLSAHGLAGSEDLDSERFRASLELRSQVRKAFHDADNHEAIRRSLLRRSRPLRGPYLPGQWLLYWVKRSSPNRMSAGRWHGPARVLSTEGSSIVWLRHGTRTVRAPPEYLRPASLREWNQLTHPDQSQVLPQRDSGGGSQVINLEGLPLPPRDRLAPAPLSGRTTGETSAPASTAARPVPAPLEPDVTGAEARPVSRPASEGASDGLTQPEQELTPQESHLSGQPEPLVFDDAPSGENIDLPDDADDGLCAEHPIMLAQTVLDEPADLWDTFHFEPGSCREPQDMLLAEDELPWHEHPRIPSDEEVFYLEVLLKPKDVTKWLQESNPEQMIQVAAAAKRSRAEVSLKRLSPAERTMFETAKEKELSCWVQTNAIRRILRSKLNPEQILRSRWVLTWKDAEPGSSTKKAKARLVVLGYQDPDLTSVARDSPTLSREGRSVP